MDANPIPTPTGAARPAVGRAVRQRWQRVAVEGLGLVLPEVTLPTASIEDRLRPLYARLGFKPGWVEAVTGIRQRRVWGRGESAVDGAVRAAAAALAEAGIPSSEVQALVSCSVAKNRLEPSLACEIQAGLGLDPTCLNHDVGNACLGFLSGLATVANMIELGQIEVGLVVAGEDATPVLEATIAHLTTPQAGIHAFKDHLATLTLGSAAVAWVLVSDRRARRGHRLEHGTTLAATEHHGLCRGALDGMVTDSVRLLKEGVALAGRTWAEFSDASGWRAADVGTAALHQVGQANHEAVVERLGLAPDRAPRIYPWIGNVGACGVAATATLARDEGRLRAGDRLALCGIGSGLNCAMFGVTW